MGSTTKSVIMYTPEEKKTSAQIVEEHGSLVKRIAHHLMGKLPPSVQVDDLCQAGMIGLLEAAKNYDVKKGASFETYAGIRIRGSMLDEIRKGDWAPRSVHKNTRLIASTIREIENRTGRDAKDHEVANAMHVTLNEYHKMLQDTNGTKIFGFDDVGVTEEVLSKDNGQFMTPLEGVQKSDFKQTLAKCIASLPERERLVLALYYEEELNLKEVGDILGVSESRVSQIHSQSMIRLQARMKEWNNE